MLIRAGFNIAFQCPERTTFALALSIRPERQQDLITPDIIAVSPKAPMHHYRDVFGNRCSRVVVEPGQAAFTSDFLIQDSGRPDPVAPDAVQHAIEDLPDEVLSFLLPSRYCEVEQLMQTAWSLFGSTPPGWARVQAIVDYVHERVRFSYGHARPTKTAFEVHAEQHGVCRDFAHLAIALCRCMNIPARYCTGYLGDIGIEPIDAPMDFSAWFQVFLGGAWRTFDARHNRPRIGRILIAVGRDATDVAISTAFGQAVLTQFKVVTEEVHDWSAQSANLRHSA